MIWNISLCIYVWGQWYSNFNIKSLLSCDLWSYPRRIWLGSSGVSPGAYILNKWLKWAKLWHTDFSFWIKVISCHSLPSDLPKSPAFQLEMCLQLLPQQTWRLRSNLCLSDYCRLLRRHDEIAAGDDFGLSPVIIWGCQQMTLPVSPFPAKCLN